jgi:[ribosomal protein S18]-alanine N-acetyltransferase
VALTLDELVEEDLDAALAIDLDAFAPSEIGAERDDPRAVRAKQLREELTRPWARVRAAREDGALVGYILYWHVADELHLLNVAVRSDRRRTGIARALMEDLFAYGRAGAAAKVLLEVRASNTPAIGLYEALGFTRLGERRGYYADGEDALEMIFVIQPSPT